MNTFAFSFPSVASGCINFMQSRINDCVYQEEGTSERLMVENTIIHNRKLIIEQKKSAIEATFEWVVMTKKKKRKKTQKTKNLFQNRK